MDAHKRYTIWLVFLIMAGMLILVSTSYYLEPLSGDQTRLGGYAENDFGWNQPQKVFSRKASPLQRAYGQYADVLVVGDSFSFAGNLDVLNYPWQTFLTAKTGFSVATIIHYLLRSETPEYDPALLSKIVNSETFQKTPPRILIMEVIERQLGILYDLPGDCQIRPWSAIRFGLNPIPDLLPTEVAFRDKTQPPLRKRMAFAKKYLIRLFQWEFHRLPVWNGNSIVSQLGLTTGKLFSSKQSSQLLVYEDDLKKKSWDENKLASIQCQLVKMQNLLQKNGKTLFVAMIVPDKLSAYSRYLSDQSLANLSVIDRLASNPSLHLVRIDRALKAAIDEGAVDVYLPDDTHWAYRGQETAAEALVQYLKDFSE